VPHLILNTQLEVMKNNLEEVRTAIASIQGKDLRQILELPPELRTEDVKRLSRGVNRARNAMVDEDVEGLVRALDSLEQTVAGLSTRLGPEDRRPDALDRRAPIRLGDFQTTFNDEIGEAILAETLDLIDELQHKLEAASALEAAGDETGARAAAQEAWQSWAASVVPGSAQVFSEYVEFLGGLALRYTGFDRGICRIADNLIHGTGRLPGFTWASVTLPALREAISPTQVIGLGFPEWTVWALPLGAHALGDGLLRKSQRMPDLVHDTAAAAGRSEDEARECLADAFATYVMGPAYACAAILLRLDPFRAFDPQDDGLIARRAQYVLRTLKHLNDRDPNGFATDLVSTLTSEWEEALGEVGYEPVGAEGGIDERELARIDTAVAELASRLGVSRAYKSARWPDTVVPWAQALADGSIDDVAVEADANESDLLRDVLNAAWWCRYQARNAELDLGEVDNRAKRLWERLEQQETVAPGQGANWLSGSSATATKPEPPMAQGGLP
jgi:hypothetical protein